MSKSLLLLIESLDDVRNKLSCLRIHVTNGLGGFLHGELEAILRRIGLESLQIEVDLILLAGLLLDDQLILLLQQ